MPTPLSIFQYLFSADRDADDYLFITPADAAWYDIAFMRYAADYAMPFKIFFFATISRWYRLLPPSYDYYDYAIILMMLILMPLRARRYAIIAAAIQACRWCCRYAMPLFFSLDDAAIYAAAIADIFTFAHYAFRCWCRFRHYAAVSIFSLFTPAFTSAIGVCFPRWWYSPLRHAIHAVATIHFHYAIMIGFQDTHSDTSIDAFHVTPSITIITIVAYLCPYAMMLPLCWWLYVMILFYLLIFYFSPIYAEDKIIYGAEPPYFMRHAFSAEWYAFAAAWMPMIRLIYTPPIYVDDADAADITSADTIVSKAPTLLFSWYDIFFFADDSAYFATRCHYFSLLIITIFRAAKITLIFAIDVADYWCFRCLIFADDTILLLMPITRFSLRLRLFSFFALLRLRCRYAMIIIFFRYFRCSCSFADDITRILRDAAFSLMLAVCAMRCHDYFDILCHFFDAADAVSRLRWWCWLIIWYVTFDIYCSTLTFSAGTSIFFDYCGDTPYFRCWYCFSSSMLRCRFFSIFDAWYFADYWYYAAAADAYWYDYYFIDDFLLYADYFLLTIAAIILADTLCRLRHFMATLFCRALWYVFRVFASIFDAAYGCRFRYADARFSRYAMLFLTPARMFFIADIDFRWCYDASAYDDTLIFHCHCCCLAVLIFHLFTSMPYIFAYLRPPLILMASSLVSSPFYAMFAFIFAMFFHARHAIRLLLRWCFYAMLAAWCRRHYSSDMPPRCRYFSLPRWLIFRRADYWWCHFAYAVIPDYADWCRRHYFLILMIRCWYLIFLRYDTLLARLYLRCLRRWLWYATFRFSSHMPLLFSLPLDVIFDAYFSLALCRFLPLILMAYFSPFFEPLSLIRFIYYFAFSPLDTDYFLWCLSSSSLFCCLLSDAISIFDAVYCDMTPLICCWYWCADFIIWCHACCRYYYASFDIIFDIISPRRCYYYYYIVYMILIFSFARVSPAMMLPLMASMPEAIDIWFFQDFCHLLDNAELHMPLFTITSFFHYGFDDTGFDYLLLMLMLLPLHAFTPIFCFCWCCLMPSPSPPSPMLPSLFAATPLLIFFCWWPFDYAAWCLRAKMLIFSPLSIRWCCRDAAFLRAIIMQIIFRCAAIDRRLRCRVFFRFWYYCLRAFFLWLADNAMIWWLRFMPLRDASRFHYRCLCSFMSRAFSLSSSDISPCRFTPALIFCCRLPPIIRCYYLIIYFDTLPMPSMLWFSPFRHWLMALYLPARWKDMPYVFSIADAYVFIRWYLILIWCRYWCCRFSFRCRCYFDFSLFHYAAWLRRLFSFRHLLFRRCWWYWWWCCFFSFDAFSLILMPDYFLPLRRLIFADADDYCFRADDALLPRLMMMRVYVYAPLRYVYMISAPPAFMMLLRLIIRCWLIDFAIYADDYAHHCRPSSCSMLLLIRYYDYFDAASMLITLFQDVSPSLWYFSMLRLFSPMFADTLYFDYKMPIFSMIIIFDFHFSLMLFFDVAIYWWCHFADCWLFRCWWFRWCYAIRYFRWYFRRFSLLIAAMLSMLMFLPFISLFSMIITLMIRYAADYFLRCWCWYFHYFIDGHAFFLRLSCWCHDIAIDYLLRWCHFITIAADAATFSFSIHAYFGVTFIWLRFSSPRFSYDLFAALMLPLLCLLIVIARCFFAFIFAFLLFYIRWWCHADAYADALRRCACLPFTRACLMIRRALFSAMILLLILRYWGADVYALIIDDADCDAAIVLRLRRAYYAEALRPEAMLPLLAIYDVSMIRYVYGAMFCGAISIYASFRYVDIAIYCFRASPRLFSLISARYDWLRHADAAAAAIIFHDYFFFIAAMIITIFAICRCWCCSMPLILIFRFTFRFAIYFFIFHYYLRALLTPMMLLFSLIFDGKSFTSFDAVTIDIFADDSAVFVDAAAYDICYYLPSRAFFMRCRYALMPLHAIFDYAYFFDYWRYDADAMPMPYAALFQRFDFFFFMFMLRRPPYHFFATTPDKIRPLFCWCADAATAALLRCCFDIVTVFAWYFFFFFRLFRVIFDTLMLIPLALMPRFRLRYFWVLLCFHFHWWRDAF